MNLRKTIAGVTVALGSTAVVLGLGGTAQAADLGLETRPDVDAEPGRLVRVGDVLRVDTNELAGHVRTITPRDIGPEGIGEHVREVVPPLAEKARQGLPVELQVDLGR
ncbi:hypothetical protein [Saccharothrix lopnurensis]|uniref:SAF domain-containing protein n=1 Tax=Saccharothrix lopnurensis TaxID=1670621 RepID=A0ABW1NY86_9PSEU